MAYSVGSINRLLDSFVQQQLWTESAGGGYADLRANVYQQLQQVYGQPGSDSTLDSTFNNFTGAVQALSASPSSFAAQSQAVNAAQAMAQQLNSATQSIQSLRSQADQGIAGDVQQANNALQQIAKINMQLSTAGIDNSTTVTLEDQRDQYIKSTCEADGHSHFPRQQQPNHRDDHRRDATRGTGGAVAAQFHRQRHD